VSQNPVNVNGVQKKEFSREEREVGRRSEGKRDLFGKQELRNGGRKAHQPQKYFEKDSEALNARI